MPMAEEAPSVRTSSEAAELVAKRWNPQIVRALLVGCHALLRPQGRRIPHISDGLLSERLKELEAAGS